jgi:hypothetical protein
VTTRRRFLPLSATSRRAAATDALSASRGLVFLALLAALTLASLFAVAPAGAVVAKVGAASVGLQPRNSESLFDGNGELGASFANPAGNPVVHSNQTFMVFWDPTNSYHGDWQNLIDVFANNLGAASGTLSNVFAVDEQYNDRSNVPASNRSTFKGASTDTDPYPTSGCTDPDPFAPSGRILINHTRSIVCLTDAQIQAELQKFISAHKLPTGMSTIFYLLTPPGVAVCLDGGGSTGHCSDYEGLAGSTSYENSFCSYHSDINPGAPADGSASTILYGAIPWTAGGRGDFHLPPIDQKNAIDCQSGGFDPSSKPTEEHEHAKEMNEEEEQAFEKATKEEKEKLIVTKELEEGHEQQPNQAKCPSPDGGCDTGLADLIINQIAVEQQNIVTNPLLNSWQDVAHDEATDECRNWFSPVLGGDHKAEELSTAGTLYNQVIAEGHYYLNTAFNLAAFTFTYPGVPCIPGVWLEPRFTAPSPVNSGELVGFDGMESTITLNSGVTYPASGAPTPNYPTYTWNFGDGSPEVTGFAPGSASLNSPAASPCEAPWLTPCAASTFHAYQYGGSYEVTLTVKDVGGNVASTNRTVNVAGPPPPTPSPEPPAPSPDTAKIGTGTTGSSNGGSPGTTTTNTTVPGPTATQAVTSHSLATVLRSGLVVRYSVSEQVAGRFEVLLASSLAKKLGIHGSQATGLAKGTPAQTVIAKAILVTTKGGHSTYRIKFSKATAARLRKVSKVTLMIRLAVHNAKSPKVTTVLDTVNLAH